MRKTKKVVNYMKLLSLDLSTQSTGYAYGQKGKLEGHGCLTASNKDVEKRIIRMRDNIKTIIEQNKIDTIIMQEVRQQFSSRTSKVLMWLQAAIVLMAYEVNPKIKCQFMGASTWRAALRIKQGPGVKREKVKQYDMQYVLDNYGIKVNDDESDAICLFDAYFIKDEEKNEINW